MTLLLQIQDYMAAGHQLLGIRTSNALLLQLLSDSILPYDIQILLSCYKQGPGWLRSCLWQGWVLACKPSLYSSCKTCCCGFWGFCCYPAIMQLFLLKESIAFFFLFFFSAETAHKDLSPVVLHLALSLGEKNQSGMEAVEPQQETGSLLPVSCCDWKLSCRCH